MRVAIDAVGIRGHGGAAVLCELLQWLPVVRPDWDWHVYLFERRLREFDDPIVPRTVTLEHTGLGDNRRDRLQWVRGHLCNRLRKGTSDLLFSFANIAPSLPVVPQVVFCQQSNAFFNEGISIRRISLRCRLWFMRLQIMRGARASRAVIVQTDAMRERIAQVDPSLQDRICVIPSGYRTAAAAPRVRASVRKCIESVSHPRLIYVSHPGPHKNHLALIRAMSAIADGEPSARLMLTIDRSLSGVRCYSEFAAQIQAEARRLGLVDKIVWLGSLTADEVDFALRLADLMVFPSLAESFGLGMAEAIAAGCPVAAADLQYAHDVCEDAAVYFDPCNPCSISRVVLNVCKSPVESSRLREAGLRRKPRFSYETIAEKTARVLEEAASGTKGPRSFYDSRKHLQLSKHR